jgi:hypothetical protein
MRLAELEVAKSLILENLGDTGLTQVSRTSKSARNNQ